MPPSRLVLSFAAATTFLLAFPARAEASASPRPGLVVVAEPTRSDALENPESRGPITLAYGILEIFEGEVSGASVIVRHDSLGPEDRERLAAGERVILIARADPAAEGRWIAPAPLRATPSAVSAFRKWSAPEDVRAARPLSEVVAEVSATQPDRGSEAAAPAEHEGHSRREVDAPAPVEPSLAPAPTPTARAVEQEGEIETAPRREIPVRRVEAEPLPAQSATARPVETPADRVARAPEPAPARAQASEVLPSPPRSPVTRRPEPTRAAAAHRDPTWDPPLAIDPLLQPQPGPGLPPEPVPAALGPEVSSRKDLRVVRRGGRRP